MARGGFPGFGGNFNNILKQAEKMQKDALKLQEELENKEVEATSGGGAVKVVVNGKKVVKQITISKDVVDPDDVEMLQDLILLATNEALRQIDEYTSKEMEKVTGSGIPGLPGLF